MLVKYKLDLKRPFDEATTFLNKIELQLSNLCNGAFSRSLSGQYCLFTISLWLLFFVSNAIGLFGFIMLIKSN